MRELNYYDPNIHNNDRHEHTNSREKPQSFKRNIETRHITRPYVPIRETMTAPSSLYNTPVKKKGTYFNTQRQQNWSPTSTDGMSPMSDWNLPFSTDNLSVALNRRIPSVRRPTVSIRNDKIAPRFYKGSCSSCS